MSDLEFVLLTWAVVATVLAAKWRFDAVVARTVFMHFVRDAKEREKMLADWEAFKKERGA